MDLGGSSKIVLPAGVGMNEAEAGVVVEGTLVRLDVDLLGLLFGGSARTDHGAEVASETVSILDTYKSLRPRRSQS